MTVDRHPDRTRSGPACLSPVVLHRDAAGGRELVLPDGNRVLPHDFVLPVPTSRPPLETR